MMYPVLYSATETNFDHNGIGILSACVSCEVTEEANGIFELAMTYPMDGVHFSGIGDRSIIKAKADQFRKPQLFRVYAVSKPMNGIVTVLAEHISYDLSGIPVKPFTASAVPSALTGLKNNAVVDCPFDFWTDKATSANFKVSVPSSIRSRLVGVAGSILDVYGGEYEFDNYIVRLHNSRGMNRGVSIRYGKNLTDIQQEQNCSNVVTGVYPYWAGVVDEKDVLVELPEKIVNAPGAYNFVKIRTLDLSREFETQPTVEQLRAKTESYIKANDVGVPKVSLTVSFAQIEQTDEYKHLNLLERVSLFDTVNVEFPALGVSATAKAVKMVYDVLADRVKSVTLGSVRANIADTVANQQTELEKSKDKPSVSMVQKISSALAKAIMGANGGAVRLIDTNDDGEPDELYISDNADPTQAVKVWRFNYNGWAASKNGYSGPFEFGATLEDGLLANFVTAAQLVAGTIKSQDNGKTFFLDLDNGILKMNATEFSVSGKSVSDIAEEKTNVIKAELDEFTESVTSDIETIQNQIDGSITTWFDDYVPTANNEPAVNWTTDEIKNQHLGDLFYIVNNAESGGRVYRWAFVNNAYDWQIVEDSDVTKALADAAKAQDTADGKRRVFVVQPTPPYDKGDLWTDGADLMVCNTPRTTGSYYAPDWVLATTYIDSDTAGEIAQGKVDSQTQTDIFNKLTNNGLSQGLFMLDGDLYVNASYLVTGIFRSKDGTTFYLDLDKGILRGKFEEFTISGKTVDDIAQEKADAAEDNAVGQASDLADAAAKNAEKNAREELNNYAATVSKEIKGLQSQIDKNITTWFGDYVPQRINSPAMGWIVLEKEEQHQGDLFYVVDNEKHGGKVYRWVPIDGIYEWRLIEDTELAKALADAAKAQDTADGKRRVFVDEPVPPYDVGDLWAQGSGGDLMRCIIARESGSYDASDWDLASKYIDEESAESIAQNKVDSQTQEDIFNKLTNNGQDQGIYIQDGLVYINATYIKSGKIVSEGMAYLPPTYDDCIDMLMSLSFPDRYPPKDFYDINGDGVFDVEDVRLANMVYLGKIKMADCAGAVETAVTVTIDPFNAEETVVLSGINAWGKQISMSLGVTRSRIPHIDGDCTVSNRLSVGGHLVTPSLALAIGETPKTLSWKDNGDGTFTPIGQ